MSHSESAGPALRGFRLQMLYTLARLTEPRATLQATLWPEGVEDLAIFDDRGVLREAIQIKAHTAPLTRSELVSRRGNGLMQRAVETARTHPECRVRLLSFGPFGQELQDAWDGTGAARDRVTRKLRDAGLSPTDVAILFDRLTLERVDEAAEQAKVDGFLGTVPALAGQSAHAAAILCQWLYTAAERRERIAQADLIVRLAEVGRYLHARDGYWRDWFSVVEPLDPHGLPDIDPASERDRLAEQFQQGTSARYEHIVAGCDIPRRPWLDRIGAGFAKASVVVVHGASGQGKSALAYRWLHDETPDLWRLEVKLAETRRDALQIAATLSSHARAVGAPLTIYLDVRPGDLAWTDLVQELARLPQIRVLVSIREEDWRRATLSGAAIAFEEIRLTLEESEAREIYGLLDRPGIATPFLAFEDAWRRFVGSAGTDGPLMEFVYLVTRAETLRDRLKQQVDAIRDAAIEKPGLRAAVELLALVSFASALGARLDIASLREHFPGTDLGRIVERLEMEYLVRRVDRGLQLDGLHPVRSRLLADILCDGIAFTPQALARRCLDLLWVDDTESFLLHFASGHAELMTPMVRHLDGWQPRTWAAIGGVLRALLWWGVRQYVDRVSGLVAELMDTSGKAWLVTLDLDLVGLNPPYGTAVWRQLDFVTGRRRALLQSFYDRQPPKASALESARRWLPGLATPPTPPETLGDWAAVSELSYWAGRWSIDAPVAGWLRAIDLTPVLAQLPLQQLSDLLLGRWELEGERMRAWLDAQRECIAARFREETDTVWIADRDDTIRAHFIVSWEALTDGNKAEPDDDANRKDRLHAEAVRRVGLMRGLFPNRVGYGCQGYGHEILPMPYDSTTKTAIQRDGLPPEWATRVNGFANRLIERQFRPDDWADYLSDVQSLREEMTSVMRDLRYALVAHFRSKRKDRAVGTRMNMKAWDALRDRLGKGIALPRQAVDEWGFVAEGLEAERSNEASRIAQGFALSAYRPYLKSQSDLLTGLKNFLNQAFPHLFLHYADGIAGTEVSRLLIQAKLDEAGDNFVRPGLVAHNLADAVAALPRFQGEFRRLFDTRVSANQLDEQDRREQKTFDAVLPLFTAYLASPTAHWPDPERRATSMMWNAVDQVPARLIGALSALESEGIRASRLKQPKHWEHAPALWISLDSEDPLKVFAAVAFAKPLLQQGLMDAGLSDEQGLTLHRRWEQIVLVSLFRGRALERQAWLIPIDRLTSRDPSTEFEWLDQIPRTVADDAWVHTGLQCWNSPEISDAREFLLATGRFKILTKHLSAILGLAKTDDADCKVIQGYLDRHQAEWSAIVQALIDGIAVLAGRFNTLSDSEQTLRPFLAEAAVTARDHYHAWLPPGLADGQTVMSVEGCRRWCDTVTAQSEALDTVAGAWILDTLSQGAALSGPEQESKSAGG